MARPETAAPEGRLRGPGALRGQIVTWEAFAVAPKVDMPLRERPEPRVEEQRRRVRLDIVVPVLSWLLFGCVVTAAAMDAQPPAEAERALEMLVEGRGR